jgi:putative flippase GtrA
VNATTYTTQFVRFLAAGGLAAAANIVARMGLSVWLDLPVAVILAYLVGMAVAFILMRGYVFPPGRADLHRQIATFALVNVAALLQTLVVTLLLANVILPWAGVQSHVDLIAHVVGVAIPIVTSFIGHRRWSFR